MTRQSPKRRAARHAEQQRRVQAALSFWQASLAQLAKHDETESPITVAADEQSTEGGGPRGAFAPGGASSHGRQTFSKSQLLDRS